MLAQYSQHRCLPRWFIREKQGPGHLRWMSATGGFFSAACCRAWQLAHIQRAEHATAAWGRWGWPTISPHAASGLHCNANFKGGTSCFAIWMQSSVPVPMTQYFQQPRAFCQTHLLALLCLCYYLLFNPVIILANSGKVSQDAACWEDTTKLSTVSSSSDPDLLSPPLPACTQDQWDWEPSNPSVLIYNPTATYQLLIRATLFCILALGS